MEFKLPTKKQMNLLYSNIKRLYSNCFYEFVEYSLEQNIIFISTLEHKAMVIVSPAEKLIHVFMTDDEIMTCHQMLSGDSRAIATYGVNNIVIEEVGEELEHSSFKFYLENFKHFKTDDGKTVFCSKFSSGQAPSGLNKEECERLNFILEKLYLFQEYFFENEVTKEFEEEMFCTVEFEDDEIIDFQYEVLESLDLSTTININPNVITYVDEQLKDVEINAGTLYLGEVISGVASETYHTPSGVDVQLTNRYLYSLDENYIYNHLIYTSTNAAQEMVLANVLCRFLNEVGLFDTIITNNINIYNTLCMSLEKMGIDIKLSFNNDYCNVLNDIMGKVAMGFFEDQAEEDEFFDFFEENLMNIIEEKIASYDNVEEDFDESETEESSEYVS